MRRLRSTDGTPAHLRAAQYHVAMCQDGPPLMSTLGGEMSPLVAVLLAKARAVEDAKMVAVNTQAAVDKAEIQVENTIRDLDAAAASADRGDAALNAQKGIFPDGFGADIEPEGEDQLAALVSLWVRAASYKNHALIAPVLAKLSVDEKHLRDMLKADEDQNSLVDMLFEEEKAARSDIRVQIESAYGRLRTHFKLRPALAERYFLNEGGGRKPKNVDAPGKEPDK